MSLRVGIWSEYVALLRAGVRYLRTGGARLAGLILVSQLIITGIAIPVIGWIFREALRAGGFPSLDTGNLRLGSGVPLTLALIVTIVVLAFWLISLQFTSLIVLLHWAESGITARGFIDQLRRVAKKLLRPSSFPLVLYLFILLPLSGFGFTSALVRGISIPPFITGELSKGVVSGVALTLFFVVLVVLNVRLAATVPVFVLTDATGGRALRASWRLTRGFRAPSSLVLAGITSFVAVSIITFVLFIVAILPTVLSDAVLPTASPFAAAYSLGLAQVAGILLSGFLVALVAAIVMSFVFRRTELLPPNVSLAKSLELTSGTKPPQRQRSRFIGAGVAALCLVVAIGSGTASIGTLQHLASSPDTLVFAHRGFSDGGVENTISGLEAAAEAGADLVEMDVMQTQDGEFVAMHDANLDRLADRPDAVKDLTLDELTSITVHDLFGHSDTIPSFTDYVNRAQELNLPLLIEIKLGGADTPDHVEKLVDELESLNALDSNMYHTLDAASVATLKRLRPDLTVGYIMPFAGGDVPETPADFIVVEEWSATEQLQREVEQAGLGFVAWTVNDDSGMREHLRRNSDGIITDHPDQALEMRSEMQDETGLSDVLLDALTRFVVID